MPGALAEAATGGLLRLATSGSVDDGKSTLIGRLLYDSKQIADDQLQDVERLSEDRRRDGALDLALLTDGLRAEREQGITIDVAYRYFQTDRRKFIVADTPGHVEFTRNMVTGASTADLQVVLVDARHGVLEQSRRHACIASLLRIRHLVVCVNKMDLVGWDESVFAAIAREFGAFAAELDFADVTFLPISALHGDNVVDPSANMPWYQGPTLLSLLESLPVASDRDLFSARLPVQWVIEAEGERRAAGQVAGGILRPGEEVVVLPAGTEARIAEIHGPSGPVEEAFPPLSVSVVLEGAPDVARGDLLCRPHDRPAVTRSLQATLCWMAERPLEPGARYDVKHTTRTVAATVEAVHDRLDVLTLEHRPCPHRLGLNDIGTVTLALDAPLTVDPYTRNRTTGSFILVDPESNDTVAAGLVAG